MKLGLILLVGLSFLCNLYSCKHLGFSEDISRNITDHGSERRILAVVAKRMSNPRPNPSRNIPPPRPNVRNNIVPHGPRSTHETFLRCEDNPTGRVNLSHYAYTTVLPIANFNLTPSLPFTYDYKGNVRTSPFMWKTSNKTYMCTYHIQNLMITKLGILVHNPSHARIRFDDPSVLGASEPFYERYPDYLDAQVRFYGRHVMERNPPRFPLVVPARMKWDDCFNHFHFQVLPLIGAVHRFHYDVWDKLTWHTSRFTAALLLLLGVPMEKLIIEKVAYADEILLPWYPYWNPLANPAFRGASQQVCQLITTALLQRKIEPAALNGILKPNISIIDPTRDNSYTAIRERGGDGDIHTLHTSLVANPKERLVVIMARPMDEERRIVNLESILKVLYEALAPGYKLVVMQSTPGYREIPLMHALWQQYAKVISHAKVLIGAHGSALTNMIWAPDDCHTIEINEFPDYKNPASSPGQKSVRNCIIWGHWAKTTIHGGNYYTIEPTRKDKEDFYLHNIYLSVRELLQTIQLIDNGALIKPGFRLEDYPFEEHRVWTDAEKTLSDPVIPEGK